jgi:dTDP-4-amino-4,6-dideoxygalactose transaminase
MIPFNRAFVTGNELRYVGEALESGHPAGAGPFSRRCESMLEEITGAKRALLTTSCTDALEMAAMLLDIKPGDEVIVPSFTFVSTANAFVLRGAIPRFCDVRPDTLNLDEEKVEELVTPRTRAIVLVHYAGVGCKTESITVLAHKKGFSVVEDNAHGLFGRYQGRALGSIGALATLSFHETKNVSSGEGGAILINDDSYVTRAEILREKGTDRSRFFRGEIDKYSWVDIGSSFLPSEITAACLAAQLESYADIQRRRKAIWTFYYESLAGWSASSGARLPVIPAECDQPYHLFYVLAPERDLRDRWIRALHDRGVDAVFHYVPLHLSTMGARFGGRAGDCPVSEDASERLIRLPLYSGMTESEMAQVVDAVCTLER